MRQESSFSPGVSTERRAEIPGFILERTARRMKQYFQEQLQQAGAGITIDQWVLLQELDRLDGQSQLDLARATFKDQPTVTRIIDLLCEKGLTRRSADPEDRRRFRVELTEEGRRKIDSTMEVIREARRQAWSALSEEETERLVDMLDRLFRHLT